MFNSRATLLFSGYHPSIHPFLTKIKMPFSDVINYIIKGGTHKVTYLDLLRDLALNKQTINKHLNKIKTNKIIRELYHISFEYTKIGKWRRYRYWYEEEKEEETFKTNN